MSLPFWAQAPRQRSQAHPCPRHRPPAPPPRPLLPKAPSWLPASSPEGFLGLSPSPSYPGHLERPLLTGVNTVSRHVPSGNHPASMGLVVLGVPGAHSSAIWDQAGLGISRVRLPLAGD